MRARLFRGPSKPRASVVRLREAMINGRCTFVGTSVDDVIDLTALEAKAAAGDVTTDAVAAHHRK